MKVEDMLETKDELFPNLIQTPIPLLLPLSAYVGEYKHPGYGSMVVGEKDGELRVDCMDRTWRFILAFEHISGEFFGIEKLYVDDLCKVSMRAEFRLSFQGKAEYLGLDL